MANAEDLRAAQSPALGCHPVTGAKTVIEPSPAHGVVPSALATAPGATPQIVGHKLAHGFN